MNDANYVEQLKARMNDRVNEIKAFETKKMDMTNFLLML